MSKREFRIFYLHRRANACIRDAFVRNPKFSVLFGAALSLAALMNANAAGLDQSTTRFVFKNADGKVESVKVLNSYTGKWNPFSIERKSGAHLDPSLLRAATIAEERAHAHSKMRCWRYVKEALVASGAVNSYPRTEFARDAGAELVNSFGFVRLAVQNPYDAPVGSVLVYGSGRTVGHVEIRTPYGFASDFRATTPSRRPLIGVYAKVTR
jgi:hypothetical protein